MKVKKIKEKEKINMQLLNKKKVEKLKEKGITLIALVVTIIILLILAGVTLNMALSGDGLFAKARNAADKYKKAQEDEQDLISEIGKEMNSEYVGAYVTGYTPKADGTCTISGKKSGTGEDQTFSTAKETDIKWRIWDYDGTILRIILDKPTTQQLTLKGADGYNNGVWIMNEICRKCFSNEELGATVSNLKRSDIEKVSTYDYTKNVHSQNYWLERFEDYNGDDGDLIHYGEAKSYTNEKHQSPAVWRKYDSKWNFEYDKDTENVLGNPDCKKPWEEEFDYNLGNEDMTDFTVLKQSGYEHNNRRTDFFSEIYYEMLFPTEESFWLGTRCTGLLDDLGCFSLAVGFNYSDQHGVGFYSTNNTRRGGFDEKSFSSSYCVY